MKRILVFVTSAIAVVSNSGCGKMAAPMSAQVASDIEGPAELLVDTRELSWGEIQRKGYASVPPVHSLSVEQISQVSQPNEMLLSAEMVNAVTGIVKLIDGKAEVTSHTIGHAIPVGATFEQISAGEENYVVYNKTVKSLLGVTVLNIDYKISFRTKSKFKGKGAYIADVTFVPLAVYVDGLYDFKVTSHAGQPVNKGTALDPAALLKVNVTFNLSGFGSNVVTDQFGIHGDKTAIEAVPGKF